MQRPSEPTTTLIRDILSHRDLYTFGKKDVFRPGEPHKKHWPARMKQEFIETVLHHNETTPLLVFLDKTGHVVIIDGVERMQTIFDFVDDRIKTFTREQARHYGSHSPNLHPGVFFFQLPVEWQDQFLRYPLSLLFVDPLSEKLKI